MVDGRIERNYGTDEVSPVFPMRAPGEGLLGSGVSQP
jgi:hypothetical protein